MNNRALAIIFLIFHVSLKGGIKSLTAGDLRVFLAVDNAVKAS